MSQIQISKQQTAKHEAYTANAFCVLSSSQQVVGGTVELMLGNRFFLEGQQPFYVHKTGQYHGGLDLPVLEVLFGYGFRVLPLYKSYALFERTCKRMLRYINHRMRQLIPEFHDGVESLESGPLFVPVPRIVVLDDLDQNVRV